MDRFYLITNRPKDIELSTTKFIQEFLRKHNKTYETFIWDAEDAKSSIANAHIQKDMECIIVLGGDGTLLQVAGDTIHMDIPLLGINLGTLGYLAEVEKSNITDALEALMAEEYEIEERMMLSGEVYDKRSKKESTYALNDIVITRYGSLRIISYDIYVNGQFLNSYHADGIILSTPTGSTGYNLSAGGPIVEPKAELIVITPICPHTLHKRSIVLAADDKITVEIVSGKDGKNQEVEVSFDGKHNRAIHTGDKIEIMQSVHKTKIIKLSKVSFLEVLRKKMSE